MPLPHRLPNLSYFPTLKFFTKTSKYLYELKRQVNQIHPQISHSLSLIRPYKYLTPIFNYSVKQDITFTHVMFKDIRSRNCYAGIGLRHTTLPIVR